MPLSPPIIRYMHHIDAQVDAVHSKGTVPFSLALVNALQFLRIKGHVEQVIFDPKNTVQAFENPRRLHIDETTALSFVLRDILD